MPFKNFKNLKIGKSKEKTDADTAEEQDVAVSQISNLEEHLNDRTQNLEETGQQLEELSDTVEEPQEEEAAAPQPHGPLNELEVGSSDEPFDEETDVSTLLEEAPEELNVVKVDAGAEATAEAEKEPEATVTESDSLDNLFSDGEDEENPLASLISAMPDVTSQELLDDLQEIKEIIQEWQHN